MARITIVGAGIVALACAHWLARDGHQITLVDRDPEGDKCSWGNAGALAVTSVVPASVPGLIWRVPRWLFDPLGPLAIRPAHAPRLLPWMRRFLASGRPATVARIAQALATLNGRALGDWMSVMDATGLRPDLHQVGALTVYEQASGLAHEATDWAMRRRHGIACQEMSGAEARRMEPALWPGVAAAVFTPAASYVSDPKAIWRGVLEDLRARQVRVLRAEVSDLGGLLAIAGPADYTVIAAGAWSARLARTIGDAVLLESERGYNTTLPTPGITVSRQIIFAERHFVATPLSVGLRIGGASEFAGLTAPANYARARALLTLARRYLPGLQAEGGTAWMGNRPATPDGLPVIGRSPRRPDVLYAFGHGHLGLTQSATTGRLIADLVAGRPTPDLAPYSAARFATSPLD